MIEPRVQEQLIARAIKDPAFRQEVLNDPKQVLAREYNIHLAQNITVRVLEEAPNTATIVLPPQAETVQELSDKELETAAGGYRFGDTPHTDPICTPHQN